MPSIGIKNCLITDWMNFKSGRGHRTGSNVLEFIRIEGLNADFGSTKE